MVMDFFKPRRRRNEPVHSRFQCVDCGAEWGEPVSFCTSCGATHRVVPVALGDPAGMKVAPVQSAADLRKKRRVRGWNLGKEFNDFLGRVPKSFDMLIWGPPGGGKSTLGTKIIAAMAEVRGPVLIVSAEEGTADSTLDRLERLEIISDQVLISSAVNWSAMSYDIEQAEPTAVMLDSFTHAQVTDRQLIALREKHDIPLIVTAHATKENQAAGPASLPHWVDIVVRVGAGGKAATTKNRFGACTTLDVFASADG